MEAMFDYEETCHCHWKRDLINLIFIVKKEGIYYLKTISDSMKIKSLIRSDKKKLSLLGLVT